MQNKSRTKPKVRFYEDLKELLNQYFKNYDTITPNYDTKNIYKVNQNFYFRKKINYKLYRISLYTKNLEEAIKRKNILNKMNKEELLLKLNTPDYKIVFEYDTDEDLEKQTQLFNDIMGKLEKVTIKKEEEAKLNPNNINIDFIELENIFIKHKKDEEIEIEKKIGERTWEKWYLTFKELINHFSNRDINDISEDDFKEFRQTFKDKGLQNDSINQKMNYVKYILDFALQKKFINENKIRNIKGYAVEKIEGENFTKEELEKLIKNDLLDQIFKDILKIIAYSGLRVEEFYNLKKENLKELENIKYIKLENSKTKNGIREIPIHKNILELIHNFDFDYIRTKWKSDKSFRANLLNQIYKIVPKSENKTTHTLRANFMQELLNNNTNDLPIIQQIVGHSLSAKDALTINTYAKGFSLKNKQKVIDSIREC
ncbi:tyrosine-type recombinase/integrase [Aliarcobacter cryaerophilus]|uniref:tyrosine-type recombinase/integrase n=1 Tax=Aliarcobacter cryaerophilus TaxID=28198 RepID=UPI0021B3B94B|nr:tyrosine-type recombinase/integrase [Aliarcobacter cryaerophilus]MCT7468477.1 tyrosine-type recombinase/integrase [Aliarcobacter cryaerophilus]